MSTFSFIRSLVLFTVAGISFACGGIEANDANISQSSQALERDNTLYGKDATQAFRKYCATPIGLESEGDTACEDARVAILTNISVPPVFEISRERDGQFICAPWEATFSETFDWNSDNPSADYTTYELESAQGQGRSMDCKYTVTVNSVAKPKVVLGGIK